MGNLSSKSEDTTLALNESSFVHNDWNIMSGKLNGNAVTVFSSHLPSSSRKRPFIDRAVQFSKIYRHPSLLKYMDIKTNAEEVSIVTENALPLQQYDITSLSSLEIIIGLLSILEGLIFLHDKAGVSHNNICYSSIYITSNDTWKLWGFEYMCSFGDLTKDHIAKIDQYCCQKFIPPDEKNDISPAYQHARDSFAFAELAIDLISEEDFNDIPGYDELIEFLKTECMHKDWTKRPRLSVLLCQTAFKHDFLQIKQKISNILLLSNEEKESFIRLLPTKLKEYPEELVAVTLMPSLLTRPIIDIHGALTLLMPFILIPNKDDSGGFFSPKIYKKSVVPLIVKLFNVHDLTIRMTLLKYFYHYAELIPKDDLTMEILPQLLLGIRDSDESLVASTLIDLAYLVPLLGADVVVGSNRESIFSQNQPKKAYKANKLSRKDNLQKPKETNVAKRSAMLLPPTRSSPDGGEAETSNITTCRGEWSDWGELIDDQPDIVGSLKVMTTDLDDVFYKHPDRNENKSTVDNIINTAFRTGILPTKSRNNSTSSSNTSSAMQLKQKSLQGKKATVNEFDSMAIKVVKKSEPDLFEDLKPVIKSSSFNFERMLIEAESRTLPEIPASTSLSKTLSEIQYTDVSGNEWQDEANWSSDNA